MFYYTDQPCTSLVSYFVFLLIIFLVFVDEDLWINPSANLFVFEDFNTHHKDWLTYSGWTDRPAEFCYSFSVSNDLTQLVNFLTWIPYYDSYSPALLDLLFFSDESICSTKAIPAFEISIMWLPQFQFTFHQTQNGMPSFIT